MQFILIVVLCIVAAVMYGIVHDQVTARVCVEYFTIGHPPVLHTESPTLLGLGWGVIATWWVGLLLGIPMAIAARVGTRPKRSALSLVRPIGVLLAVMGILALVSGLIGYVLARQGVVFLVEPLASMVPAPKHVAFIADLWAHSSSYLVGFVGGIVLVVRTWKSRAKNVQFCSKTFSSVLGQASWGDHAINRNGLSRVRRWICSIPTRLIAFSRPSSRI